MQELSSVINVHAHFATKTYKRGANAPPEGYPSVLLCSESTATSMPNNAFET
jgi:hypothetical protein